MSGLASAVFSATMLGQTLRMAVPYACAALGGVWSERSGVVNIGLEGILLASALGAAAATHATGSPISGMLAGAATGALLALVHAVFCVRGRIDAIVSGIALNLVAAGGTRYALRLLYGSSSNSPPVEGFRVAALDGRGEGLFLARTVVDPLLFATVLLVALSFYFLDFTKLGLRVRACGEDPGAARSAGISVDGVRIAAVSIGGAICGVGGCAMVLDQHGFVSGMSNGRGFIALAAVIVSGWRPVRAALACLAFAALEALQVVVQGQVDAAWTNAVQTLPYAATLFALLAIGLRRGRGARPPAGLGKHAD